MAPKKVTKTLRNLAMRHPETEVGVACEGTALERTTVKVRKKAFLFVGVGDAMLKLDASLAEAKKLAKAEPTRWKVGAHGWVTATFSADAPPPLDLLETWIAESYALVAGPQKPVKKVGKKVSKKRG